MYFYINIFGIAKNVDFLFFYCFVHPIFRFSFLDNFGDEVTKILRYLCLHFARQDGQDGKKGKKIAQLK